MLNCQIVDDIHETRDLEEITTALESILEIPNEKLRPKIITKIEKHLKEKFLDPTYKISVYIAYTNLSIVGFVIVQIDPYYTSYGKKCATFGWLRAKSFEVCRKLMKACENFTRENGYRKLRGPINFPKGLGGIGGQVEGYNERLIYGVAFNPPNIVDYLSQLKYKRDAEYICVHVTKRIWKKGKKFDKSVRLGYLHLDEIIHRKEEIMAIVSDAFNFILPDHSGTDRFEEFMSQYALVPKTHYKLPPNFNPEDFSDIPEFIEGWESCNLENVVTWAPLAFDRKTGEIVGAIFSLPDIYQLWLDEPITRDNVDTVFIKSSHRGKGIFSALHNFGQFACRFNGVDYFEGTCIWNKNEQAVQSIFPHSKPLRKHIVFQKRLHSH